MAEYEENGTNINLNYYTNAQDPSLSCLLEIHAGTISLPLVWLAHMHSVTYERRRLLVCPWEWRLVDQARSARRPTATARHNRNGSCIIMNHDTLCLRVLFGAVNYLSAKTTNPPAYHLVSFHAFPRRN